MKAMDRIIGSGSFPLYQPGDDLRAYEEKVDKIAAGLKRSGMTHVRINESYFAIPRVMDPQNGYLQFMEYGYCLNQYVVTSYDKDIYYAKAIALNQKVLTAQAAIARRHGLRCYIMCVEPTFMQESLFARYPHWRGPRVDNPACSFKPIFAPCVMLPDVQDYYRQQIRGMLELAPEIDEIHIFTNDTGAGFCHSSHLYAGPSGPVHCKSTSPGKHAQALCRAMLEAGREINPAFRVVMTSGLGPREKADFIDGAPEGVCSSVYGAFAWGGGLEAYWGTMAVGPKVFNNPRERRKVQDWQDADMRARVAPLKANNTPLYASYNPCYYRGDDPRPFETYRITCDMLDMGIANIIGGPPPGEYSINGAVMRRAIARGREEIETVVLEIATAWVGAAAAPTLVDAWRATDLGSCEQPMLWHAGHCILLQKHVKNMPLVPDDEQLSAQDLDYYMDAVLQEAAKSFDHAGGVWRSFHYEQDDLMACIDQYDRVCLPAYRQALALVERIEAVNEKARECLEVQKQAITACLRGHGIVLSWMQAAIHKMAQYTVPAGFVSFDEIVTRQLELYDHPRRAALMEAHRGDALRRVNLGAYPVHRYGGVNHWEGAHEAGIGSSQ